MIADYKKMGNMTFNFKPIARYLLPKRFRLDLDYFVFLINLRIYYYLKEL